MKFKPKNCRFCGVSFIPRTGIQNACIDCRTKCPSCGVVKSGQSKPGLRCRKCSCKEAREFARTCQECAEQFTDRNNKTTLCPSCMSREGRGTCCGCGIKVSDRATRCNSCRARDAIETNTTFAHKYEFDGIKYRSKWEAEFARRLTEYGVEFEYERYCPASKGFPDFYIPAKGLYIEIHPDWHGPKRLPENCILVKTQTHAKAIALNLGLAINPEKAGAVVKSRSRRTLCYDLKACEKLAIYLRRAIAELDGQEVRDLDDMVRAGLGGTE